MKITFVKDCPPIIESGNSAYKAGVKADLRLGQSLIDLGYARDGWEAEQRPLPTQEAPKPKAKTTRRKKAN